MLRAAMLIMLVLSEVVFLVVLALCVFMVAFFVAINNSTLVIVAVVALALGAWMDWVFTFQVRGR